MKRIGTFLNPYSFKLDRTYPRFYEITGEPVYENGPYKSYRYAGRYFCTCRGNIILMETTTIPTEMIEALIRDEEPTDYTKFRFRRIKEIYAYALECAKRVGFTVIEE